jgi:hypothetical protein
MNENNIKINIIQPEPRTDSVPKIHASDVPTPKNEALTLAPNPINLYVKTDTDWPTITVGIGGVFTTIVIAFFSYITQKNQVRANIASIRSKWLEDLRETAAKFTELASIHANRIAEEPGYLSNSESTNIYCQLIYTQSKLSLMLDKTKRLNTSFLRITNDILALMHEDHAMGHIQQQFSRYSSEFESTASEILEQAWSDIKNDLNVSFFSFLRRRK